MSSTRDSPVATISETSDRAIIDLLRQHDSLSIGELAEATSVTATAVRQRLNRMMAQGLIERHAERLGRGRPSYRYLLTDKGLRQSGANYSDLAIMLWNEIRAVQDPQVRRGLLQRLSKRMAGTYSQFVRGGSTAQRMESISRLMDERDVPFDVDDSGELPVLTARSCPYPELAAQDRGICSMEQMLFSEVVGTRLRLSACRLDGDSCCTFEAT